MLCSYMSKNTHPRNTHTQKHAIIFTSSVKYTEIQYAYRDYYIYAHSRHAYTKACARTNTHTHSFESGDCVEEFTFSLRKYNVNLVGKKKG